MLKSGMDAAKETVACRRCGANAAGGNLLRSPVPSVWAFVAIVVTTDAEGEPMSHHQLVDRCLYCRSCRRVVVARRLAAYVAMIAISLGSVWLAVRVLYG